MAEGKGSGSGSVTEVAMQIGDDLWIEWHDIADLREQDVNAQQMQPRHMDRLTENIRIRGQIESLPYCYQPEPSGPVEIVSGHHRARAARAAGLKRIPVIVDKQPMTRGRIVAKQIAHNELHGEPDEAILAELVRALESVDDMLMSGLDENWLPTPGGDDTDLLIPHAEFDWRMVMFLFLPTQIEAINELAEACEGGAELIGAASLEQFDEFSHALVGFARNRNIKNMAVAIDVLTTTALRAIEAAKAAAAAATP
jgi:hypothetical protein